ncbi:MAG: hypothetical protein JF617_18560 [Burkholderiales bacterium]|nr:hypothetical protein [Burkholderiales bacterium]
MTTLVGSLEAGPGVGALEQAVRARADVEDVAVAGVDPQLLAVAAAQAVAVGAEQGADIGDAAERGAMVGGAHHHRLATAEVGHAGQQVDDCAVLGVECQGVDAEQADIGFGQTVEQRDPVRMCGVPTVGATDVRARIEEAALGLARHDGGDIAAAADGQAVPAVGLGLAQRGQKRQRCCQQRAPESLGSYQFHFGRRDHARALKQERPGRENTTRSGLGRHITWRCRRWP